MGRNIPEHNTCFLQEKHMQHCHWLDRAGYPYLGLKKPQDLFDSAVSPTGERYYKLLTVFFPEMTVVINYDSRVSTYLLDTKQIHCLIKKLLHFKLKKQALVHSKFNASLKHCFAQPRRRQWFHKTGDNRNKWLNLDKL